MQLRAVAHRNHRLTALVVMKEVMNRIAGAAIDIVWLIGIGHGCAAAIGVESEADGELRVLQSELDSRHRLELSGRAALVLVDKLSALDVKAKRRIRIGLQSVLAGQRFKLCRCGCSSGGLRPSRGKSRRGPAKRSGSAG